ncbi:MAG: hypothetical protein AAB414_01240 [Patescibacteria group bacterium]
MSKKVFVIILILSVVVTYGVAFVDDIISPTKNPTGLPFAFASFNFLGGSTNGLMLILDIAFWFAVILGIWKALQKITSKR